jgi:diguanylate cyclase (GGDEF)-like protein
MDAAPPKRDTAVGWSSPGFEVKHDTVRADIKGMVAGWAVLAACVLLAVPTALWPGERLAANTYLAGLTLIVGAVWWGALRAPRALRAARRGWTLIAVTASCWLAGDTMQRVLEGRGHPMTGVGPADALWLASYLPLIAAVTQLIGARGLPPAVRREIRLDVTVATTASAVAVWQLMIAPAVAGGDQSVTTAVSVLYPLGDVAIVALALTLVLAPGRRGTAGWLVIGCLGMTLAVDALFTLQPVVLPGVAPERLDALLLVTNGLLAAAALHPGRGVLAEAPPVSARPSVMHRWRVVLLGLGLSAVTVGAALPSTSTAADHAVMTAAGLAISVAILARFYGVVQERESAEALLLHQANHDQLTGLANRALLLQDLAAAAAASAAGAAAAGPAAVGPEGTSARDLALLYVDLDGFKAINDGWGHAAGDEVLRVVAGRLLALSRAADTVARVGGDEFVVFCPRVRADAAEVLARDLRDAVRRPIDIGAAEPVTIGASIGVHTASAPVGADGGSGPDVDELLRAADSAMYRAKRGGAEGRTAQLPGQRARSVPGLPIDLE